MVRVRGWLWTFGVILFFAAAAMISNAQTFTTLANFDGKNGRLTRWAWRLSKALTGTSTGRLTWAVPAVAWLGNGCGTVFKVTPDGK